MRKRVSTLESIVNGVKRIFRPPPPDPPYKFPIQIGDPLLRMKAEKVKHEDIKSEKVQALLKAMRHVLHKARPVAISAPQIGVLQRIFMTELPPKECSKHSAESREGQKIDPWPLKVFINPELQILDNKLLSWREGCISLLGYSASVPRHWRVKVRGLDEEGKPISWEASGFAARVIQHEMDHLDGVMYTDRMHCRTLEFVEWEKAREQKLSKYRFRFS